MSNQNDTEFAALADELIEENGRMVTFFVPTAAAYDPTSGDGDTGSPDPVQFVKKVSPPSAFSKYLVNGTNVLASDVSIILRAKGLEFELERGKTQVDIDGTLYTLVEILPVYSGDDICIYELQLRK